MVARARGKDESYEDYKANLKAEQQAFKDRLRSNWIHKHLPRGPWSPYRKPDAT